MNSRSTYLTIVFLILSLANTGRQGLVILDDSDPGLCDRSNHGEQALVKDRQNNELILICTKNNDGYKWTTAAGGDFPIGEFLNPGYDCSDIIDKTTKAEDGLYWIHLDNYYPQQVYCDMVTDGGGYMLVGRKNSSKTWDVPSNDIPVELYGDPHWASYLGDAPILDFRIQIATGNKLDQTKAHWSLRLQSPRPLKELMIDDQGCDVQSPGIGNIAYVKDVQTDKILTTNYRCSIFGLFQHPITGFGWHKMNHCLKKPCSTGYAYWDHPSGSSHQVDFFGSFSFSATGNYSGVNHDATAFVGCSQNQICCGCFGPVGGMDDYCRPDCTAKNGGTVVKDNTYTWFWVRSSLPKRVWNRCMEYKVTNENGDTVSYKLLDGDTTPEEGHCPKNEPLINEGIVVVPDGKIAKKIPKVPGLLQYRKDDKKLYLRSNETWKVIAPEEKILKKTSELVGPKFKSIEEKFQKQNRTVIKTLNNDIAQLKTGLKSNIAQLKFDYKSEIAQHKTELKSDIVQLQTELQGNITQLKKGLRSEIAQLRSELSDNGNLINQVVKDINDTLNNLLTTIKDPLFESVILYGEPDYRHSLKLWIGGNFTAKLCWRASRDGWAGSIFHSNCDNKVPTVTIVKVGNYIFGGYATASWSGNSGRKKAPGSFLFSFKNKENLPPFKAPLKDQNTPYAIYASSSYGPTFGAGHDLHISNNAASNTNSFTYFNDKYQAPSGVSDRKTILAGTYIFTPTEVEVFYLV